MITLTLPYPPSANRIWRNVGDRTLKSTAYRNWLAEGWAVIKSQRPTQVKGRYRLTVVATRPDNRARDIDNLAKPISDLLKAAGVIEDDHLAQSVFVGWSDEGPLKGGCIIAQIEPLGEA